MYDYYIQDWSGMSDDCFYHEEYRRLSKEQALKILDEDFKNALIDTVLEAVKKGIDFHEIKTSSFENDNSFGKHVFCKPLFVDAHFTVALSSNLQCEEEFPFK